jgi:Hemerythrin HHE cation binding domain
VAVILNALRALRPPAPAVRLTAADTALTRRFRTEHQAIRADIDQLRTAADTLDEPGAMTRVRQVYATLTSEVWPHESAEEDELYPSLNRVLGGADPTAPMSRAHAEIAYQIARLGRLTEDIGDREPDASEIADLRGAFYGLHAILRLHTVQEDETYLSLRRQRRRPVPLTARSPRTGGRDRCRQSPGQGQAFCGSRTSTAPVLALNCDPWHGQTITFAVGSYPTVQSACGHTASKARNWPERGWITIDGSPVPGSWNEAA